MNEKQTEHKLIFYSTPRVPCSYLKGRFERRVFTSLGKEDPKKIHSELSLIGFRRSYGIIYKPACGSCRECIPVRVMVKHFVPSKSHGFKDHQQIMKSRSVLVRHKKILETCLKMELSKLYISSC